MSDKLSVCRSPSEETDLAGNDKLKFVVQPSVYGRILHPRHKPGFDLAPVMVTWEICVFVIANSDRSRQAFVSVPRDNLETFVAQLDSGVLDQSIREYLNRPVTGRKLYRHKQARQIGFYDVLGPRINLLSPELHPRAKRWRRMTIVQWIERPLKKQSQCSPCLQESSPGVFSKNLHYTDTEGTRFTRRTGGGLKSWAIPNNQNQSSKLPTTSSKTMSESNS